MTQYKVNAKVDGEWKVVATSYDYNFACSVMFKWSSAGYVAFVSEVH